MHTSIEAALIVLLAAVAIDAILGEYPRALHPVVWTGKLIEAALRWAPSDGWWRQFLFGAVLAVGLPALVAGVACFILQLAGLAPALELLLGAYFLKASLALRELAEAARRVVQPLEEGKLTEARSALRSLCSRDPEDLDAEELLGATIESLAENAADSFVAPLFYFMLLGVPGAVGYRVINTLDAMVGYRGKFEALGKCSARLDDIVNFVPARLTALLLLLAGCLQGLDAAAGWRILRRDAAKTPSPNAGRPMAVMAGLLHVQLTKRAAYVLGDRLEAIHRRHLEAARRTVVVAAFLMVALCVATLLLVRVASSGG